ncbi:MAG: P-II family nitrogen regulator [Acidithiobacillus sp.]|nr:P-II family nitrogen regulator [Acidithiobacillus sp.]MDD5378677.1 P-II family nitrogen regulator [Acidithiobacillus sp.]
MPAGVAQVGRAIIGPFKLDDVCDALATIGIQRMAVTEGIGFDQRIGYFDICCGHAYVSDYIPRIKIEVVTSDEGWITPLQQ